MPLYTLFNGPFPTTAAPVPVTTGTVIKTMLQLKPFNIIEIVEWGISFDGFAAALPPRCELLTTGTVFATVTAHVDADISKVQGTDASAASVAGLTLGTAATGYTASAEGAITVGRILDLALLPPTGPYVRQWSLGQEPRVIIGDALRIRVTAGTAVLAYCWLTVRI